MTKLKLLITFYRSYAFVSFLITLACLSLIYSFGNDIFIVLFWFKIVTLGLIFYFVNSFKRKELYYYKNLGVSKKLLWISSILFDLTFYLILSILTLKYI